MTQLESKISADDAAADHCATKNFVKKTELEFLQQRMDKEIQQMRQDFKDLEINLHKKQFKLDETLNDKVSDCSSQQEE